MKGRSGLLLAGVLVAALTGQQAAAARTPTACTSAVTGAAYSYKANGGLPIKGNRYRVSVIGVSCASAESAVAKLTTRSPGALAYGGAGPLVTGGPAGFKCVGKSYTYTRHRPPVISGDCWQGNLVVAPTKLIMWAPVIP